MQRSWTTVRVNKDLWQLLDTVSRRTGLKKGILIEKAVRFFVMENREALAALGLSSEDIESIAHTYLTLQEAV